MVGIHYTIIVKSLVESSQRTKQHQELTYQLFVNKLHSALVRGKLLQIDLIIYCCSIYKIRTLVFSNHLIFIGKNIYLILSIENRVARIQIRAILAKRIWIHEK